MHLTGLLTRLRARLTDERGITMFASVGALMTTMMLGVAAYSAANGDLDGGRRDIDEKRAYAAAEAGIANYLFHLNSDNAYWAKCTTVTTPHAVNQAWNGTGADPRQRLNVPGSAAQYAIELLPANGATSCSASDAQATMIDAASSSFRIRATGFSRNAKRSIVATFKRRGFLDYLYFTDYETSDPTWYEVDTRGRPTRSGSSPSWSGPDLVTWANQSCVRYRRSNRAGQSFSGQIYWFNNAWQSWNDTCTEIQFAPGDVISGPFHTNDEIYICGSPNFGRTSADRVEVSGPAPGWRSNSGCSGNNPTFLGTWVPDSPLLTLPPTDAALKQVVAPAYLFTGRTTIVLGSSTMTVNGVSMSYPANGVIYVQNGVCGQGYRPLDAYNSPAGCGDVILKGTYGQDLTIASEKDIILNDDVRRSGDVMLGLIANNFVRIYHPVSNIDLDESSGVTCSNASSGPFGSAPGSITIDAAILSLQHSFTVDYYFCGSPTGTLTINGTIGQKFRGPVGRGGDSISNGYVKAYTYDDRLKLRSPPHFLDPVQSSWRIQRYHEQTPPR